MQREKKKILFMDHAPFIGGAQISLIKHLEKLDRNRFEPVIACSANAELLGLTETYKGLGIKYCIIPFGHLKTYNPISLFNLMISISAAINLIRREKVDIIF